MDTLFRHFWWKSDCTWGDLPLSPKRDKTGRPCSTHANSFFVFTEKTITRWEGKADTQTGMLLASQKRNVRSKFWWFTEFCNSHYVSHFAAFFIVARAKISIAESCILFLVVSTGCFTSAIWFTQERIWVGNKLFVECGNLMRQARLNRALLIQKHYKKVHSQRSWRILHRVTPNPPEWVLDRCGNDPSAGSPTDTLLRLHLPLNVNVWLTSHGSVPNEGDIATVRETHGYIQSVGATGGVYKGQGRNQCKLMTCVY